MTAPTPRYQARARVARALGSPTRLLMLEALRAKQRTVSQLVALVGSDQSTVSKHLAVLRDAGLVESRREGMSVRYSVQCDCLDGVFRSIESVVRQQAAVQIRILKGD